jgi:hypothetical protein
MPELIGVERARSLQMPGEKRQPAIATRQHSGNQLNQAVPTLIVECEHAIDRRTKLIRILMSQRPPRGLFIQQLGVLHQIQARARPRRNGQLARQPCVESINGFDAQPRWMLQEVQPQRRRMTLCGHAQGPGPRVHGDGALRQASRMQGLHHPLAHFLRGPAREGERQDALRRIDRRQQTQVALRQQRGLA